MIQVNGVSGALHGMNGVAVTASGKKVYLTEPFTNTVYIIDTAIPHEPTKHLPVGHYPWGIAVTYDGTKVYVTNLNDNTVSVIDTATNTVTATVPVGINPIGIAVTPDGTKAYVANSGSGNTLGNFSVIDTATNTVKTVLAGDHPRSVAVSDDGKKAYVVNQDGALYVIDTATDTVTSLGSVGGGAFGGIVVSPDGTKVYVANDGGNTVSIFDTVNHDVKTVTVGHDPMGISVTPDGKKYMWQLQVLTLTLSL